MKPQSSSYPIFHCPPINISFQELTNALQLLLHLLVHIRTPSVSQQLAHPSLYYRHPSIVISKAVDPNIQHLIMLRIQNCISMIQRHRSIISTSSRSASSCLPVQYFSTSQTNSLSPSGLPWPPDSEPDSDRFLLKVDFQTEKSSSLWFSTPSLDQSILFESWQIPLYISDLPTFQPLPFQRPITLLNHPNFKETIPGSRYSLSYVNEEGNEYFEILQDNRKNNINDGGATSIDSLRTNFNEKKSLMTTTSQSVGQFCRRRSSDFNSVDDGPEFQQSSGSGGVEKGHNSEGYCRVWTDDKYPSPMSSHQKEIYCGFRNNKIDEKGLYKGCMTSDHLPEYSTIKNDECLSQNSKLSRTSSRQSCYSSSNSDSKAISTMSSTNEDLQQVIRLILRTAGSSFDHLPPPPNDFPFYRFKVSVNPVLQRSTNNNSQVSDSSTRRRVVSNISSLSTSSLNTISNSLASLRRTLPELLQNPAVRNVPRIL